MLGLSTGWVEGHAGSDGAREGGDGGDYVDDGGAGADADVTVGRIQMLGDGAEGGEALGFFDEGGGGGGGCGGHFGAD